MRKFEIKLRILNKIAENKWEFVWNGQLKKSEYSYTTLYVEDISKESVTELVASKSKNSLQILDINEVTEEDATATDIYLELSTTLSTANKILEVIGEQRVGFSNN